MGLGTVKQPARICAKYNICTDIIALIPIRLGYRCSDQVAQWTMLPDSTINPLQISNQYVNNFFTINKETKVPVSQT